MTMKICVSADTQFNCVPSWQQRISMKNRLTGHITDTNMSSKICMQITLGYKFYISGLIGHIEGDTLPHRDALLQYFEHFAGNNAIIRLSDSDKRVLCSACSKRSAQHYSGTDNQPRVSSLYNIIERTLPSHDFRNRKCFG